MVIIRAWKIGDKNQLGKKEEISDDVDYQSPGNNEPNNVLVILISNWWKTRLKMLSATSMYLFQTILQNFVEFKSKSKSKTAVSNNFQLFIL